MGVGEVTTAPEALDMEPAFRIVEAMSPVTSDDIIPFLHRLQDAYGYLPRDIILAVCQRTGLPASRVYGVATFYDCFHFKPRGRHLVCCCRGTACHVNGSYPVSRAISRELGIGEGQTSPDGRFTFETVACLGTCFLAPVVMVDGDYYGHVTPDKLKSIFDQYE